MFDPWTIIFFVIASYWGVKMAFRGLRNAFKQRQQQKRDLKKRQKQLVREAIANGMAPKAARRAAKAGAATGVAVTTMKAVLLAFLDGFAQGYKKGWKKGEKKREETDIRESGPNTVENEPTGGEDEDETPEETPTEESPAEDEPPIPADDPEVPGVPGVREIASSLLALIRRRRVAEGLCTVAVGLFIGPDGVINPVFCPEKALPPTSQCAEHGVGEPPEPPPVDPSMPWDDGTRQLDERGLCTYPVMTLEECERRGLHPLSRFCGVEKNHWRDRFCDPHSGLRLVPEPSPPKEIEGKVTEMPISTTNGGEINTKTDFHRELAALRAETAAELEDAQGDLQRAELDVSRVELMAACLVRVQVDKAVVDATRALVDTNPARTRLAAQRIANAEARLAQIDLSMRSMDESQQNAFYQD